MTESAWWDYLGSVRWFGGKGATGEVASLETVAHYPVADGEPELTSEIATLDFTDGPRQYYHLLVARYPAGTAPVPPVATVDGVDVVDATADPAAVRAFVAAVDRTGSPLRWSHPLADVADREIKVWPGEQSNTTLVLGDEALLKIFRRVEPGPNLDAEVLEALGGTAAAVPALFGRLQVDWPAGETTDLGLVMERVRDAEDGWELACAECAAGRPFTDEARKLGRALRLVHDEQRDRFATGRASGDDIADAMERRLVEAVGAASALEPSADRVRRSFGALRGRTLEVQRVHGDFHLGQTLRSPEGWTIIDFEGEPAKTAAERRELDSPWRDVAGMLRSFDYVRSAHDDPSGAEAVAWADDAAAAFLAGYAETAPDADILRAYELDKAVYEVVYEVRNRPDWVAIPLRALDESAE